MSINHEKIMIFSQGTAGMYFLLGGLYFIFKKNERLKQILGVSLLYWFLLLLKDFYFLFFNVKKTDFIEILIVSVDMTAIPICLFVLLELTKPGWLTLKKIIIYELPFIVYILIYLYSPSPFIYKAFLIYCLGYIIISAILIALKIPEYHKHLKELYSYTENIEILWLWKILLLFIVLGTIWFFSSIRFNIILDYFYYFSSALLWVFIGYNINKHHIILTSIKESNVMPKDENTDTMNVEIPLRYDFSIDLTNLFVKKQVFLNSKLKLMDIALDLNTNRTYLSDYINKKLNTNFYDLVNDYRLDYARTLMSSEENSNLTLEAISIMSGFNSLSTFRRAFIKKYGCSPKIFRKQNEIDKKSMNL